MRSRATRRHSSVHAKPGPISPDQRVIMHLRSSLLVFYLASASACLSFLTGCATGPVPTDQADLARIEHVIVIYAENRSFDNLYGLFPGANGLANVKPENTIQVDRDGKPLPVLPPVWKGKDP